MFSADARRARWSKGWSILWRWSWLVLVASGLLLTAALDARTRGLLANSARLAIQVIACCLPLAVVVATALIKFHLPGRSVIWVLLVSGMFVPLFMVAIAWDAGLGLQGWYTAYVGFAPDGQPWLSGWRGATIVHAACAFPVATLLVAIGLMAARRELEESALLDLPAWRVLVCVTWRYAAPSMALAAIWIAHNCVSEMAVTDYFRIRTFAEEIYVQTAGAPIPQAAGSAPLAPIELSNDDSAVSPIWLGTIAQTLVLSGILLAAVQRFHWPADRRGMQGWQLFEFSRKRWFALAFYLVPMVTTVVPLASLAWQAGMVTGIGSANNVRWSAVAVGERVLRSPLIHSRELGASLRLCSAAAVSAAAIAAGLAWFALRGKHWWLLITTLVLACWTIPGPSLGLGIIAILNQPPDSWLAPLAIIYDEAQFGLAPWIALTVRAIPVCYLVLLVVVGNTPKSVLESARLDNSSRLATWRHILLPLWWPGLAAATLLAFVTTLAELAATILVTPPGITPFSVLAFGLLHYGVDDQLASLCLFVWLAVAFAGGAFVWLTRRTWSRDTILK